MPLCSSATEACQSLVIFCGRVSPFSSDADSLSDNVSSINILDRQCLMQKL